MPSTWSPKHWQTCRMLACRCIAPLGEPVVPDVYNHRAQASSSVDATTRSAAEPMLPSAMKSSHDRAEATESGGRPFEPARTRCSTSGTRLTAAATASTYSWVAHTTRAPQSARIVASSWAPSIVETGTATTPARNAPRTPPRSSTSSDITKTTRSSRRSPRPRNDAATSPLSTASSAYVRVRVPRTATRSPRPCSTCRSTSHAAALNSCAISDPLEVVVALATRPEPAQCTVRTGGVGPDEDPVLPGRESAEDLGLHGLGADEPVVGLHAGQRVRRQGGSLLQDDAQLVLEVDVIEGHRDQTELGYGQSIELFARPGPNRIEIIAVAPESGLQPGEIVAHREGAVVGGGDNDGGGRCVGTDVLIHALEHVLAVGSQGQLEQKADETAARFDDGKDAAAGDVQTLERPLVVVAYFRDVPVVGQVCELGVVGEHLIGVPHGAQHPAADLRLVGAQVKDQVIQPAGDGHRPVVHALGKHTGSAGGGSLRRAVHGDVDAAAGAIDLCRDAGLCRDRRLRRDRRLCGDRGVGDVIAAVLAGQRGQLDTPGTRRSLRRGGGLGGTPDDLALEGLALNSRVDQAPFHGRGAAVALGFGGEQVGTILADETLVDDAREDTGAGQHAEQRHLGQRDHRGTVVDQDDLVAGQGELVATACSSAVEGCDPRLT